MTTILFLSSCVWQKLSTLYYRLVYPWFGSRLLSDKFNLSILTIGIFPKEWRVAVNLTLFYNLRPENFCWTECMRHVIEVWTTSMKKLKREISFANTPFDVMTFLSIWFVCSVFRFTEQHFYWSLLQTFHRGTRDLIKETNQAVYHPLVCTRTTSVYVSSFPLPNLVPRVFSFCFGWPSKAKEKTLETRLLSSGSRHVSR